MRSLSRAAVIGALALPLALGGAANALACGDHEGHHGHHGHGHHHRPDHGINVSDDDIAGINSGISHSATFGGF